MTDPQPGSVTTADLYRELVEARRQLTELVTAQRIAEERHLGNVSVHRDHERRLRVLERAWWKVTGAAAVISTVISLITVLATARGRM